MKLYLLFLFILTAQILSDDFTLQKHVRPQDIEYIQFAGEQIFSLKPMKAICRSIVPDNVQEVKFGDLKFICFTDLERSGYKLTNATTVECLIDESNNELIHIKNPVRDDSCVLNPVLVPITDEDVEAAHEFMISNTWICKENDCSSFKLTMYEMVANHVHFKSQISAVKHDGTFYFLKDLASFLWAHQ